jgi:hypothetical protein
MPKPDIFSNIARATRRHYFFPTSSLTLFLFIVILIKRGEFAYALKAEKDPKKAGVNASSTLLILSILLGLQSVYTTVLISDILEELQ